MRQAETSRPSAGLTTVRGSASILRKPLRSGRVKNSSKLTQSLSPLALVEIDVVHATVETHDRATDGRRPRPIGEVSDRATYLCAGQHAHDLGGDISCSAHG